MQEEMITTGPARRSPWMKWKLISTAAVAAEILMMVMPKPRFRAGVRHTKALNRMTLVDAILWVKEGSRRGKWYPFYSGTVIGRERANIILDDPRVSGMHARITKENDQYYIWDAGSANGTYVNGRRIREATPLDENDRVKIGDTAFIVKLLDARKKPARKTTTKKKSTSSGSRSKSTTTKK
jgi:hypothetical protein